METDKSKKELISVIIPAFNAEKYLADAIESIQAQKYDPLEIIVVDDGSLDRTAQIANELKAPIRYFHQDHQGQPIASNSGLERARGEIIAFLDADDLWTEPKLENQLIQLNSDPSLDFVLGQVQRFYSKDTTDRGSEIVKVPENWMALSHGAGLFRKSIFTKVGLFDPEMKFCADIDWFMRAREKNASFIVTEDIVLLYRRHQSNLTLDQDSVNLYTIKAFKKSLHRRKNLTGVSQELPSLTQFKRFQ